MKHCPTVLIFLLIYFGYKSVDGVVMKCPLYQLYFQKIVGFRPVVEAITSQSLLHREEVGSEDRPIGHICLEKCRQDSTCMSFLLLLNTTECYGFTLLNKSTRYDVISDNVDLIADVNAIYFEKTCLEVPDSCKSKLWAITKIPGSSLVFQGKKTLSTLVTRRECAERCIFETEFHCLSASFSASYKNNYARLGRTLKFDEGVGQCVLSDKDKTQQPDAFRVASNNEEYIENQCFDRPAENENCSYEMYANSTFIYSEVEYNGLTQKQCQHNCSYENRFYCQGVTYSGPVEQSKCFLHSEDLISMGPRSLQFKVDSVYMRRVKCLDVSVVCSDNEMIIKYTTATNDFFRGKLYVSSHSEECSAQANGTGITTLRLPIGSEIQENRCGILRAYEVKGPVQRTFISTLLVIQNNPNVQTQGDRLIKVGCILNNGSDSNDIPDDIALESSLAFTQTELPNEGSLLITPSAKIPKIYMQVIDLDKNFETNDVQIGQNLELQIIVDPPNSAYDIQATSLVARSDDHNAVYLIDKMGCPTDVSVFPALEKFQTRNKKMLRAKFHAFKFAGTSFVSFDVIIHFCLDMCTPPICVTADPHKAQGKRNRRSSLYQHHIVEDPNKTDYPESSDTLLRINNPLTVISYPGPANYGGSTSQTNTKDLNNVYEYNINESSRDTNSSLSDRIGGQKLEVPLKIQLRVRGPYVGETESLIYGENSQILVAGYDTKKSGTICINQSLLIALLIFWIVFQILLMVGCCFLIRKYKRIAAIDEDRSSLHKIHDSLDYADSNRRVRWADQGSGLSYPYAQHRSPEFS